MGSGALAGLSAEDDESRPHKAEDWEKLDFDKEQPWVVIDVPMWKAGAKSKGNFRGELWFGFVSQKCTALDRKNREYTVAIEEGHTVVVQGKHIQRINKIREIVPELDEWSDDWLSWDSHRGRDVAVVVETHGEKKFMAELIKYKPNGTFEVQFKSDKMVQQGLTVKDNIREPDGKSEYTMYSPFVLAPEEKWLLDRKIYPGPGLPSIDDTDPHMLARKGAALQQLRKYRPSSTPPLCGPFIGKGALDSEQYAAHPSPLPELKVDGAFVDTWGKFAGKIKFGQTPKIGPTWPKSDAWVDSIRASDPLYFHAALPVYAGLICLGKWGAPGNERPEFVRASDVALVGIALYANGELFESNVDPPVERLGMTKYRHQACQFIPGCVSTYQTDPHWMGAVFCLAPDPHDDEVRDDIFNVRAYHDILKQCIRKMPPGPNGEREVVITVNLVLSTNYLANIRQVCSGAIHVKMDDRSCAMANDRMRNVNNVRYHSQAAQNPKRHRKDGSGQGVAQLKLSLLDIQDEAEWKLKEGLGREVSKAPPPPQALLDMEAHWGVTAVEGANVYDPRATQSGSHTFSASAGSAKAGQPPPPAHQPGRGERVMRQSEPGQPGQQSQAGKAAQPPPPPSKPHPSQVRLMPGAVAPHSAGLGTALKPAPPAHTSGPRLEFTLGKPG